MCLAKRIETEKMVVYLIQKTQMLKCETWHSVDIYSNVVSKNSLVATNVRHVRKHNESLYVTQCGGKSH